MKKRKGLTLIEVLLSMTILSIVALVVLSVFSYNLNNIKASAKRTEKVLKTEEEINQIIENSSLVDGSKEGDSVTDLSMTVNIAGIEKEVEGELILINEEEITIFIPNED